MQTAQSLSIPFPEFATFATLPQEDIPKEPLQSPILEENLQGNRIKILLTPCEWHRLEGCFDLRKNSSVK